METLSHIHVYKDQHNYWTTPSSLLCETMHAQLRAQMIQKLLQAWMQYMPVRKSTMLIKRGGERRDSHSYMVDFKLNNKVSNRGKNK